jgi:hypothetical protein
LPVAKYEDFTREQRFINESLCPLNCLGKWIWHGSFTELGFAANLLAGEDNGQIISFKRSAFDKANGSLDFMNEVVKWSREVVNTSPNNLQLSLYDDDSGSIYIRQSGVYEVTFVFFVPTDVTKPSVQIRVNSRPYLSTIDSKQHVIYHTETDRQMSFTCFLHLVGNSKLSLSLSNNMSAPLDSKSFSNLKVTPSALSPKSTTRSKSGHRTQ